MYICTSTGNATGSTIIDVITCCTMHSLIWHHVSIQYPLPCGCGAPGDAAAADVAVPRRRHSGDLRAIADHTVATQVLSGSAAPPQCSSYLQQPPCLPPGPRRWHSRPLQRRWPKPAPASAVACAATTTSAATSTVCPFYTKCFR